MIAAPPPLTIVAAVKAVYPRSPVKVARICRSADLALVRLHVRGRESFIALRRARRGWRVIWVDGRVARSVPPPRRASVSADVGLLKTRCLAP